MIINKEQIQLLKRVSNSSYNLLKPEFLYHSNKMEGSTYSREELAELINEQHVIGDHPLNDLLESKNSSLVFDYIIDTLGQAVTEEMLFELNRMLFAGTSYERDGETGHYKFLTNYITYSHVQLAMSNEVKKGMDELLSENYANLTSLEGIARWHARFEHIHPFQDGNGRIGRMIMFKQCVENEIDAIMITEDLAASYRTWLEVAQTMNNFDYFIDVLKQGQRALDQCCETLGINKAEYRK